MGMEASRRDTHMRTATFAAGCFWGAEAAFRELDGVVSTLAGYTGGTTLNPSYKEVCAGRTGHAEAVQVSYDPDVISYEELLAAFWDMHDPTQHDRQGPDVGSQYRSAIFYHDEEQRRVAERSKQRLQQSGRVEGDVATEIVPAGDFYPAEEYHQRYLEKQRRRR